MPWACTADCQTGLLAGDVGVDGPITYQPGWGWRSEGRAMNPSRRTASQADDDLNIDTRTMYSSDCTVVLSQANSFRVPLTAGDGDPAITRLANPCTRADS